MTVTNEVVTIYSPLSIVNIFNNAFKVKEEASIISVKGIYQPGPPKEYAGFCYDSLREENNPCALTMKISPIERVKLKAGDLIEVKGFISRKVDDKGTIKIALTVMEVVGQLESKFSDEEIKALELIRKKANRGYRDVATFLSSSIHAQKKPRIKILVGTTAIIDHDVISAMADSRNFFNPEFVKINLMQPDTIISAIQANSNCDVLVLARGGGQGVEIFNHLGLAAAALECKPFLISAIGHAADQVLLEKVADKFVITPTDLGNFFKQIYNQTIEQLSGSKAKMIEEATVAVRKEFEQRIALQDRLLQEKDKQLEHVVPIGRLIFYLLASLAAGAFLMYLFGK